MSRLAPGPSFLVLFLLHSVCSAAVPAQTVIATADARPAVAIIIDDLGANAAGGKRVVALPGPVAVAMLPGTPAGAKIARLAHARGKEILLHQPLQAMDPRHDPGPGAVTLDMSRESLEHTLLSNLAGLPHVSGVNTHMGSLLTRHPGHMAWLMQILTARDDLFFVDSYTTERSVALQVAGEFEVPAVKRDVFLDNDRDPLAVEEQFERLKRLARENGYALAIGHPYPATMRLLERELPRLASEGIDLIPVAELIDRSAGDIAAWHTSSSPSPTASKNSKPSR